MVRSIKGLQIKVIDADQIGHQLLADSEIASKIRQRFGQEVFTVQGVVDRGSLAEMVFGPHPDRDKNRRDLEQILHPAIRRTIQDEIEQSFQDVDIIVVDAALLLEAGWAECCDKLIFIDTPEELRSARVVRDRGWEPDELARREKTQWSVDRKKRSADFVVDNSGTIEEAASQMQQFFKSLITQ